MEIRKGGKDVLSSVPFEKIQASTPGRDFTASRPGITSGKASRLSYAFMTSLVSDSERETLCSANACFRDASVRSEKGLYNAVGKLVHVISFISSCIDQVGM